MCRSIAESGSYPELDPVGVRLTPPPSGYAFNGAYLIFRNGQAFGQGFAEANAGANIDSNLSLGVVQRDAWHHVVVDIDATGTSAVNITWKLDTTSVNVVVPASNPTTAIVGVGAIYAENPSGVWPFNFDNVVVDLP